MAALITRRRISEETKKAMDAAHLRRWPIENCAVFCADIYVAAGFDDPIRNYRGRYQTEEQAYEVLGLFGMHGLHVRCARLMGWPRIARDEAQDGDWGLNQTEMGPSSVIRYGGMWVGSRDGGFSVVGDEKLIAAWKVC